MSTSSIPGGPPGGPPIGSPSPGSPAASSPSTSPLAGQTVSYTSAAPGAQTVSHVAQRNLSETASTPQPSARPALDATLSELTIGPSYTNAEMRVALGSAEAGQWAVHKERDGSNFSYFVSVKQTDGSVRDIPVTQATLPSVVAPLGGLRTFFHRRTPNLNLLLAQAKNPTLSERDRLQATMNLVPLIMEASPLTMTRTVPAFTEARDLVFSTLATKASSLRSSHLESFINAARMIIDLDKKIATSEELGITREARQLLTLRDAAEHSEYNSGRIPRSELENLQEGQWVLRYSKSQGQPVVTVKREGRLIDEPITFGRSIQDYLQASNYGTARCVVYRNT